MLSTAETIKLNRSIPTPQPTPTSQTTTASPASHAMPRRLAHPAKLRDHDLIIMQNKPNFHPPKIKLSSLKTMNYEQIAMNNANKNKPKQTQSNPISTARRRCGPRARTHSRLMALSALTLALPPALMQAIRLVNGPDLERQDTRCEIRDTKTLP
jgi:hypothetical protein